MRILAFIIVIATLLSSCNDKSLEVEVKESFTKIYDHSTFSASFIPIDLIQKADGGYLILSGRRISSSDFIGIQIITTDDEGNYLTENTIDNNLVHPVAPLMRENNGYAFVAMSASSLQAQLIHIGEDGQITNSTPLQGKYYPSAVGIDGTDFLLLSYDNVNKQSIFSQHGMDGQQKKVVSVGIGAGDGIETPIIEHFTRTGTQLPFFVGKSSSGRYYFNGFYNYTLSLVYTDFNGVTGVVQGQREKGGITSIANAAGGTSAIARFNFGDNYYTTKVALNESGVTSATDLGGYNLPELISNAPVSIIPITKDEKSVLVYASTTKSAQISLMFYSQDSGELLSTKYLGYSLPYQMASIKTTADGGLAILGATDVAGRFSRICLFKMSENEVKDLMN